MTTLLKTPLYDKHLELKAKTGPFAGFDMPIQYKGIIAEHKHTRAAASLFDICHMGEFLIKGPDALEHLEKCVTHNLRTLKPGKCRYGFLTTDEGTVIDDLILYRIADNDFMAVVNGSRIQADFQRLQSLLPDSVELSDITAQTAKIDLQGPLSHQVLKSLLPDPEDNGFHSLGYFSFVASKFEEERILISRTGYTGELGYELYIDASKAEVLWDALLDHTDVEPAGLGARDTLRLEVCLPLYGHELDELHTPAEAGFTMLLKSEADYAGKGKDRKIKDLLIPLSLEGRRSARTDDTVETVEGVEVGRVTSGSYCPSIEHAAALAYVRADVADQPEFVINTGKTRLRAARAEAPFYKEGTARKKL